MTARRLVFGYTGLTFDERRCDMWPDILRELGLDPDQVGDADLMTHWEADFMASVETQVYELTDAQKSKMSEIEDAIAERRERLVSKYSREEVA